MPGSHRPPHAAGQIDVLARERLLWPGLQVVHANCATPAEIALSILASIIEVRRHSSTTPRSWAAAPPATAVDPICGMSVLISPDALTSQRDGETYYFCGEGCKQAFERQA